MNTAPIRSRELGQQAVVRLLRERPIDRREWWGHVWAEVWPALLMLGVVTAVVWAKRAL